MVYYWAPLLCLILFIAGSTRLLRLPEPSLPLLTGRLLNRGRVVSGFRKARSLSLCDAESHELTPIHEDQIDFDNQENFLFVLKTASLKKQFRMEKTDLAKPSFIRWF